MNRSLPGGVASDVRIIEGGDGPVVLKQALGKLKVAADWRSDPARSGVEVAALELAAELIEPLSTPRVLSVDPATNSFTMTLVDARLRNWKADLLAGWLDLNTATRAGEVLGQLHSRSARRPELADRFGDLKYFDELRVQPFFVRVGEVLPDLAAPIAEAVRGMGERRAALVHGDFSPKNMLADGAELVLLDFEVAHWGDPRFDIAFLLAHLLLKRMRRQADATGFDALALRFLASYRRSGLPILDLPLVRLVGCIVLARTDGDSPVDYLADLDVQAARGLGRQLVLTPAADPTQLFPGRGTP